jgi:hypothetical protein
MEEKKEQFSDKLPIAFLTDDEYDDIDDDELMYEGRKMIKEMKWKCLVHHL